MPYEPGLEHPRGNRIDNSEHEANAVAKRVILVGSSGAVGGSSDIECGGKVAVGTTAVEVTFVGLTTSIIITADKDNTGLLYIGKSNVASDGSNAMTYLNAGDTITIDYNDATNAIYVVGSVAAQNFWKGATL